MTYALLILSPLSRANQLQAGRPGAQMSTPYSAIAPGWRI